MALPLASLIFVALTVGALAEPMPTRRIPCKTAENATTCYWARGRIMFYNGTPSYRLWKVGTKRLLGIYSGPSAWHGDPLASDNENPEMPANVEKGVSMGPGIVLWGDFEICPLVRERPGRMQAACVESATHLFVQNFNRPSQ